MDFKIFLLFLCITFVSVQGGVPRCCVSTAPVRRGILRRVDKFDIQDRNGACEIDALVLHVNGKKLCAPLRQQMNLEKIKSTITGQKSF